MEFADARLLRLYERGDARKLDPQHVPRILAVLTMLSTARNEEDLRKQPYHRVHPLKGDLRGYWSARISRNWRIIFRFRNNEAVGIDLVDYH